MLKNIDVFEKDPISRAVFKLALPTVLSMIVAVFYNMVDTFFVGRTGDPNQVAAVSVATPVFLFFMAAGNIFGMGGSSFLSRALGEKQYDKAMKISSFCLYAGIMVGVFGAILMFSECSWYQRKHFRFCKRLSFVDCLRRSCNRNLNGFHELDSW